MISVAEDNLSFAHPLECVPDSPCFIEQEPEQLLEFVTITTAEEKLITNAVTDHSSLFGTIFSVKITLPPDYCVANGLGLGVKELEEENVCIVSTFARSCKSNCTVAGIQTSLMGLAERSGVRLGDIVFGVNYEPLRDGSRTLVNALNKLTNTNPEDYHTHITHTSRETFPKTNVCLHLQCYRCFSTSDLLQFPTITHHLFASLPPIYLYSYELYSKKVLKRTDHWKLLEILLVEMAKAIYRCVLVGGDCVGNQSAAGADRPDVVGPVAARPSSALAVCEQDKDSASLSDIGRPIEVEERHTDGNTSSCGLLELCETIKEFPLKRNILKVRGLREALCVHIVNSLIQSGSVVFVIRIEDIGTRHQWIVHRRYSQLLTLHNELCAICTTVEECEFPKMNMAVARSDDLTMEGYLQSLEAYLRVTIRSLTNQSVSSGDAGKAFFHMHTFLEVDKFSRIGTALNMAYDAILHELELDVYEVLNNSSMEVSKQCNMFVTGVDLEELVGDGSSGFQPVLIHLGLALKEVQELVTNEYGYALSTRFQEEYPDIDLEVIEGLISKCIRRQVEIAIYLPLRRRVIRIVYSFVAVQAEAMQRHYPQLKQRSAEYFNIALDALEPYSSALCHAVLMLKHSMQGFLPSDQSTHLIEASKAVIVLYSKMTAKTLEHDTVVSSNSTATSTDDSSGGIDTNGIEEDGCNVDRSLPDMSFLLDPLPERFFTSSKDRTALHGGGEGSSERQPSQPLFYDDDIEGSADPSDALSADAKEFVTSFDNVCTAPQPYYSTRELRALGSFVGADEEESNVGHTTRRPAADAVVPSDVSSKPKFLSADEFLPIFTFVLVEASLPQLLLVKELLTTLTGDEEQYGECGYYLATLEAASQHIIEWSEQLDEAREEVNGHEGNREAA